MTTALCVDLAPLLDPVQVIKVMVSEHEWPKKDAQEFSICRVHFHPDWDRMSLKNDFAILELCEEIHFNQAAQPICLPSLAEEEYDGVHGIVSGWGVEDNTLDPPQTPKKLKEANMTTIPTSVCSTFLHTTEESMDSMMC